MVKSIVTTMHESIILVDSDVAERWMGSTKILSTFVKRRLSSKFVK